MQSIIRRKKSAENAENTDLVDDSNMECIKTDETDKLIASELNCNMAHDSFNANVTKNSGIINNKPQKDDSLSLLHSSSIRQLEEPQQSLRCQFLLECGVA
ncbi:cell division ftsZ domain protein [Orientia tsutsugamushi str. UT76]|nr:cell division ftsZ domain protein [Orientia tsutsugamushi str. UT76]